MENQEKKHKRRVRYAGAYPKNYKEKYKELNPEKYADTVSRVIEKGSTPAGMHISVRRQCQHACRGGPVFGHTIRYAL